MGEIDTRLLTQGKSAMVFANSNQLVGFQAVNKSKLGMTMYPSGGAGAKPGQYLKPAMLWSVAANSKQPKAAVEVVSFFVERRRQLVLGVERGVPASAAMREAVAPTLDDLGQGAWRNTSPSSATRSGTLPPPPPAGAGEMQRRAAPGQRAGRLRPPELGADGAKQFVTEAKAVLARG